jgi:hypothetical protein
MADGALLLRRRGGRVNADLNRVRREWEDGHRRLELASRDEAQSERLRLHLDVIVAELRRRVGGTYSLELLAATYAGADVWTRQAVEEQAATPGWARTVSMVGDAAFHVYARGAVDYTP